jgi:hypothetical protein
MYGPTPVGKRFCFDGSFGVPGWLGIRSFRSSDWDRMKKFFGGGPV